MLFTSTQLLQTHSADANPAKTKEASHAATAARQIANKPEGDTDRLSDDLDFVIPEPVEPSFENSNEIRLDHVNTRGDVKESRFWENGEDTGPYITENHEIDEIDEHSPRPDDYQEQDAEPNTGRREPSLSHQHPTGSETDPHAFALLTSDDDDVERFDYYNNSPEKPKAWLWGMLVGLMLSTLIIQSVYLFRQDISSHWPETRPWFLLACEHLGCDMPLHAVISSIRITTSDLESEPAHPGRFILHAQIRNDARHTQVLPHLELTLTDSRGRPVARRVLTPAEWLNSSDTSTSFGAESELSLRLPLSAPDAQGAAGYRLYAFYP